jgi:TolB protein
VWFHALNLDLSVCPTGGEDSISNLHRSKMVASVRTYAYTGNDFRVDTWLDALRRGHTFSTTGPLLEFHVNGKIPGDSVKLPEGGGQLELVGSVASFAPLSKVVIYNNGKIVKDLGKPGPFKFTLDVKQSGWYLLYAEGAPHPDLDAAYPQAVTNAIRVYVGDQPIRDPESAAYFIRWIDKLQTMAEAWPGWRSDSEKRHVFAQFAEARQIYERLR